MNILIQDINFTAEEDLINFTQKRADKFSQYYDGIVGIEINMRTENVTGELNKTAEIRIEVPGKDLFAKKTGQSFEHAIDETFEALRRQLNKFKDKIRT